MCEGNCYNLIGRTRRRKQSENVEKYRKSDWTRLICILDGLITFLADLPNRFIRLRTVQCPAFLPRFNLNLVTDPSKTQEMDSEKNKQETQLDMRAYRTADEICGCRWLFVEGSEKRRVYIHVGRRPSNTRFSSRNCFRETSRGKISWFPFILFFSIPILCVCSWAWLMDSAARFSCQIMSAVFANCCFLATAMYRPPLSFHFQPETGSYRLFGTKGGPHGCCGCFVITKGYSVGGR